MAVLCCTGLEESCKQSSIMPFLFRREGPWQEDQSSRSTSPCSKNKLSQANMHFLRKIRSIQGVTEAYASDKKTTLVKLENQRIVCLRGHNADPLYDCLREMYRAQENEQFIDYLQGSRTSVGSSTTNRPRSTHTIPDYDHRVSCSDNLRDYVLKKRFPRKETPRSTTPKTSPMSGSQSSLDGANAKVPREGMSSNKQSKAVNTSRAEVSQKIPLLQKALRELKGTEYSDKKYQKAAWRQIDEYMRNSLNMDFANLCKASSAMGSVENLGDDDEDASHLTLRHYENLPYKHHFPPLTVYSDESGDEKTTQETKSREKKTSPGASVKSVVPSSDLSSERRKSAGPEMIQSTSRNMESSTLPEHMQRRHTIADPQKKPVKQRYIKVYSPGHKRPIFISGATTLGGLPEPSQENRLSDRLEHISARSIPQKQEKATPVASSCPVICEAGEREMRLAAGYEQTTSLSETNLCGRRSQWDDSERTYASFQEKLRIYTEAKAAALAQSQYETSEQMEKSLQEANDLVRTLFDDLSVRAPAPVITVASLSSQDHPGFTPVSEATISSPENSPPSTGIQYPQLRHIETSESYDSLPSLSSHSDERQTV
ncbi:hypothetical protein EGW08_001243 [Elysia chlorotica]|uniref:Uncharacterized protein n=1 Tax=Elysia chlorotica TaxID=188477 RepID=A0A433UB56_ELYCH|nr:hypothetical protein EGW08_001243 [Elysia chlorotica]